jgi:hypothetical protein
MKTKKKKAGRREEEKSGSRLSSVFGRLTAAALVWAYIGLLWLVLKYILIEEINSVETAAFRFLAVYCLGFGFTLISLLALLSHRPAARRKTSRH